MDFYWIYDLENWQFFIVSISFFISFCLLGTFVFNTYFDKKLNLKKKYNAIISTFLSLSGVVYGITLGLIAVATFENYNKVESIVYNESSSLAALYSDTEMLENKNESKVLKNILKDYTSYVIKKDWPLQRIGIEPQDGTNFINKYQKQLSKYNPKNTKDEIIFAQAFDQFNDLLEKRRLRLNAVSINLPSSIWSVLLIGAFINIIFTWLLVIQNRKLDIIINVLMGSLIGSLVFLIAIMDNPFRGQYSVSAESFEILLTTIMKN